MKNTIAERIQDFLKEFPPFKKLASPELFRIASHVQVLYIEKGEAIFKQGDPCHDAFYVVREGAIGLYRGEDAAKNDLVDICDSGDLFGLRIMIIKKNYRMSALADEESIVYAIPSEIFMPFIEQDAQVNKFVLETFATHARNYSTETEKGDTIDNTISIENKADVTALRTFNYRKSPLTCGPEDSIQQIAEKMTTQNLNSVVVVDTKKRPLGIITDSDLRVKVVTGKFPITATAEEVMIAPVKTYAKSITIAEAQIALIKNNISHLCITKDGTRDAKLKGIISEHDVLVSLGNNPSVLIKEIKRTTKLERLRYIRKQVRRLLQTYIEQDIPIFHILNIVSEINDALIYRVVELALFEMDADPPVPFSFLVIGSQGRREQVLITDQDNAIIFENVQEGKYEATQNYFLKLGSTITKSLHRIGFEYCPAEMMASNPRWCISISEWKSQFQEWMKSPTEENTLLSSIFFDFRCIYGSSSLVNSLAEVVFEGVDRSSKFLALMSMSAIQKPSPLGFFKQFLVEQNGEHKDSFDIKTRAMMILIDAARILALHHHLKGINNTILRYQKLKEIEPENKELFDNCEIAYKVLLKFRARQGIQYNDSGRFIDLNTLSKRDKLRLKRCFRPIKDMQELLKVRFQLKSLV